MPIHTTDVGNSQKKSTTWASATTKMRHGRPPEASTMGTMAMATPRKNRNYTPCVERNAAETSISTNSNAQNQPRRRTSSIFESA